jgi:hypothetical protein
MRRVVRRHRRAVPDRRADHAVPAEGPGPVRAEGISQANATLFMGACIALTAFPMLARIINERGLAKTSLGTLSLTAGAFDDACSWCVLAIVLATFGGGPGVAVLAIGGGLAYAVFIILFGRAAGPAGPHGRARRRDEHDRAWPSP